MSPYRHRLPQLGPRPFITDGGIETTLIFLEGIALPHFASFILLNDDDGVTALRRYYARYAALARQHGVGIVLETPTWRASADWVARLGYDRSALADVQRKAVDLLLDLRAEYEAADRPVVISGNLGPRGDGYRGDRVSAQEAETYHRPQIAAFAASAADMVSAFTMNHAEEAIGIVRAAGASGSVACGRTPPAFRTRSWIRAPHWTMAIRSRLPRIADGCAGICRGSRSLADAAERTIVTSKPCAASGPPARTEPW